MRKVTLKSYFLWIALCEAVGGLAAFLTRNGMAIYNAQAIKPPLTPPAIAFPIVWGLLFALMGVGAAKIAAAPPTNLRRQSLSLFFAQLIFNFFWSIIFFNLQAYGLALLWLLVLWALILLMILSFRRISPKAARLQVPYLLWVSFAAYLNLGVWLLN